MCTPAAASTWSFRHRGLTAQRGGRGGCGEVDHRALYARMTHDRDGKLNRVPYSIDNKAIYSVSRGELEPPTALPKRRSS